MCKRPSLKTFKHILKEVSKNFKKIGKDFLVNPIFYGASDDKRFFSSPEKSILVAIFAVLVRPLASSLAAGIIGGHKRKDASRIRCSSEGVRDVRDSEIVLDKTVTRQIFDVTRQTSLRMAAARERHMEGGRTQGV